MTDQPLAVVYTLEAWHYACAWLRARSPYEAAGFEVRQGRVTTDGGIDAAGLSGAAVIVIQRDFPRLAGPCDALFAAARQRGIPVIYEIDDLLWAIPPDHPAHARYRDARGPILHAISQADAVTTPSDVLARRMRALNPHTHGLPNYLDARMWPLADPVVDTAGPLTIGCIAGGTHGADLAMVWPALDEIRAKFGPRVRLRMIGQPPPDGHAEGVEVIAHVGDYAGFAAGLARPPADILIAPLVDTPFNRCKSAIKAREYAAAGAPGVFSAMPPYIEHVRDGVDGLLAGTRAEWVAQLSALIESPELRSRLARAASQRVRDEGLAAQHGQDWRSVADAAAARARAGVHPPALPGASVIVLNYNGRDLLDDNLASLEALDYPTDLVHLIVADNGSSDGSAEFVQQRHPGVRVIPFAQNLGFSAGYNRAIGQVDTEMVALLNSDMRVEPGWLAELARTLLDDPQAACAGSKILSWDGATIDFAGHALSPWGYARGIGHGDAALSAYDGQTHILAASGGAMLIRREAFIQAGGFDEDYFAYYEDLDLGWRLWLLGHTVRFCPASVCMHRHFATSARIPGPQLAHLYERNTLRTLIKNRESPDFERALAGAVLMRTRHAALSASESGVDLAQVRFDPRQSLQPAQPPPRAHYGPRYYLGEARRALRAGGTLALARKVIDELDRRRGRPVPADAPPPGGQFPYALAQLAALADLADDLPRWMEKRRQVQALRKRSDAEIFARTQCLAVEPWFDSPAYRNAHSALLEILGKPAA